MAKPCFVYFFHIFFFFKYKKDLSLKLWFSIVSNHLDDFFIQKIIHSLRLVSKALHILIINLPSSQVEE